MPHTCCFCQHFIDPDEEIQIFTKSYAHEECYKEECEAHDEELLGID